jgi:hemerythrin-like domain-containing protein
MIKITDLIRGEHCALKKLIKQLQSDNSMSALKIQFLRKVISTHAALEDRLLFNRMASYPAVAHALKEHQEIEKLIDLSYKGVPGSITKLTDLLMDHFDDEERYVFPLIEQKLSLSELYALGKKWARARGVVIRHIPEKATNFDGIRRPGYLR